MRRIIKFRNSAKQQVKRVKYLRRHPLVIPVVTFLVLFFLSTVAFVGFGGQTIGANDTKVVILHLDGEQRAVPTRAKTVGDLLNRLSIVVGKKDIVEPSLNAEITQDNFVINMFTARPVLVVDKGKKIVVLTADPTPRGVVKNAGLKVFPEDNIERASLSSEPLDALSEGVVAEKLVIDRATPVYLNIYGNPYMIRTHSETVGQLLAEKNVKTLEGDTVTPSPDTKITPDMQIFVVRKGKKIISQEEVIIPPIDKQEDPSLEIGKTIILDPGKPGKRLVTYEVDLENDKEVKRTEIQSIIIEQPENKVIKVGTKRNTFDGSFDAALAALRGCEAGGNYSNKNNPSYRGAYQFGYGTWNNYAGYYDPADAPPYVQDQKAWETYAARGWQPWPTCSVKLGLQDSYR